MGSSELDIDDIILRGGDYKYTYICDYEMCIRDRALSVAYGDTSPRGRGLGMSGRSMLDERSTISRKRQCSAV